jgi:preprotein translocase subunit SecF
MFFRNLKWNIIGQRYFWFALSAAVIVVGAAALIAHHGLPLGLSFTGGSTIDVKFDQSVTESTVRQALAGLNLQDENVQLAAKPGDNFPNDRVIISTQNSVPDPGPVFTALEQTGLKVDRGQSRITTVGPSLSKEYLNKSLWALVIALVLQLVYIAFRFGNQLRYGIIADIALVHDVFVMVGIYAIANRKADDAFLAALLTVIGYSVMDSIVIFDRIRENTKLMPDMPYDQMVNTSLLQTMTRSVNTLATVLITLFALYFFGGDTLKNFAFALLVGVTSGAYSSIFIASPLLVMWKQVEQRRRASVRAAVVARETASRTGAVAAPASPGPAKRTAPKVKKPQTPPPRYRRLRPQPGGRGPSSPGGVGGVGLLTDTPNDEPIDDAEQSEDNQ